MRLIHGDCLNEMNQIESKSIDMILTDLPYGLTSNKWDSEISLPSLWLQWKRILKNDGVVALTSSQPFTSVLVMSNFEWFQHEWIWIKNAGSNFANTMREPMKEHESILIFSPSKWTYNPQMQERAESGKNRAKYDVEFKSHSENYRNFEGREHHRISELRIPSSWQKFINERGLHPTQKPVALFEYLIRTYTNEGESVLDCCAGSGTTAIACLNSKRLFTLIEKDDKYFEVIRKRITEYILSIR